MRYKLMSSIVIAAVAASASPAFAQDKRTEAGDMTAAISRDLGLSPDQVKRLGEQQERAIALDEQLQKELGDGFAGSHFDLKSGQLIVNVTDRGLLEQVKGAGAEPRLVAHSLKELGEIKSQPRLQRRSAQREARDLQGAGHVRGHRARPGHQQREDHGHEGAVRRRPRAAAKYGDAVSVEPIDTLPEPTINFMDGGDGYNGNNCSAGFNLRNPSTGASSCSRRATA